MAKGNPNSAAVQYKVHLKPTEVGLLVIKRMERPHVDKSVELRRFIELGYAAERAGFSLDGAILRHAGRAWDTQPDFDVQAHSEVPTPEVKPAAGRERAQAPRPSKPKPSAGGSDADQVASESPAEGADAMPAATSPLRDKLRGLSG
jgi:hypothetical protein